ncbi:uncharacterized protein LOC110028993 [Phalaenopsis equestris]|uniref:uncharacterized protein LOC110028993 n=1 Tax=Phalaenopsis equestris TaxID=78828 RepID=UPI0009E20EC0|nr:uncharacterized protein LOC110028993 [Phalaenopsis equestris]
MKHKIFFASSKLSVYFLITSVSLLITLFQIQLIKHPSSSPLTPIFLPLKDLTFATTPMDGNTWFMSSLNDTFEDGEAEHLLFPSPSFHHNLLLCFSGRHRSNGTKNSYALAPHHSLPSGAKLFKGLTFISDSYYDYENLWHGLSAMVPFLAWHSSNGCEKPERWLLYHWGELRVEMSPWVRMLVEAVMGEKVRIEDLEEKGEGLFCFERALVFRHNEGSMGMKRKNMVYDMMRCKARAFCGLGSGGGEGHGMVRVTLLMRKGARSFKDEEMVARIFDRECGKVEGCRLKVMRPNNLSFCDQVKLMAETDVLASPHGAQLTNMFFMDKNSRVMEFFPKGWKEFAGVGQYVFQWIAKASGIKHQGPWHDSNADTCPYTDNSRCFGFYKNGQIGHDQAYFTNWTAMVIRDMREYKLTEEYRHAQQELRSRKCLCTT